MRQPALVNSRDTREVPGRHVFVPVDILLAHSLNECSWSCCGGDKSVTHPGALGARTAAPAGERGLYRLPRPKARRPLASSGDHVLYRTAVDSKYQAARARMLVFSCTRSRGGQASGHYSSRLAGDRNRTVPSTLCGAVWRSRSARWIGVDSQGRRT